jgi:hypothetical protein
MKCKILQDVVIIFLQYVARPTEGCVLTDVMDPPNCMSCSSSLCNIRIFDIRKEIVEVLSKTNNYFLRRSRLMHEIMVIMDLYACNVINMCFRLKKKGKEDGLKYKYKLLSSIYVCSIYNCKLCKKKHIHQRDFIFKIYY